ncbi:hypothetical protein AX774_g924 [Zancudomyces culisetae]|uniref:Uncharacterized protein n=1 Tax=Zancudomyces culisetae TaxID=1213189 RepID=A0A1R1PX14_ZANCU|nr:hypothetical protein AX774_g924 [Zancudomyces culisetae]|eukprot:OMH85535.1 hypothetical protein AX774_g924 [Zancudomyces culisetae]
MVFRNKKAAGKAGHNLVYQDNKPAFIKKLLSSVPETPTIHSKAMQNQHGFELLDKKARRELREAHKTDSEHRKSTEYNKTEQEGSDDRNSEIMEQAEVAKIIHKPPGNYYSLKNIK